jgi:hypothetical protein
MQIRVRGVVQLWIFPPPFEGSIPNPGAVQLGESLP